jgi:hypothetical protein
VSATADAVPKGLQGAPRARGFDGIRAKCRGNSIPELLERAPEDLSTRLELRPEAKKTETVVAGNI